MAAGTLLVAKEPNKNREGEMAQTSADLITETVGSWPEVETAPHRFGGVEFRVARRELTTSIATPEEAERGIELFRLSYERALGARRG